MTRQPVHVVYGGAHLFRADTAAKLGALALRSLDAFGSPAHAFAQAINLDERLAESVYTRVRDKLLRQPVEDYRIDFEDGYGVRSDAEEDGHATAAAEQVAQGLADQTLPPFLGIRIKSGPRGFRTLHLFLTTLAVRSNDALPANFAVTLPKATHPDQVSALAAMLDPRIAIELMIETPQAVRCLPDLVSAAGGRCRGAHFGAYDYTAELGIVGEHQRLTHPACDFARDRMLLDLAGTGVMLSDGTTNLLPIPSHPGDFTTVHRAWHLHAIHIRRSLERGFHQSWDLHPAQLPIRYAVVYEFFEKNVTEIRERLRNFQNKNEQATRIGSDFDDAATVRGLKDFILRGLQCGALQEG